MEDSIYDPCGWIVVLHADDDIHSTDKLEILAGFSKSWVSRTYQKLEMILRRLTTIVNVDHSLFGNVFWSERIDGSELLLILVSI